LCIFSGNKVVVVVEIPPRESGRGRAHNLFPYFMPFCISYKRLITGLNLGGIHERYEGVLEILAQKECFLTKAMTRYGVPRNTIRDYIGICELKIIDADKYKPVENGKASVKCIEKRCLMALGEYRAQANKMIAEGKLREGDPSTSGDVREWQSWRVNILRGMR